MKPSIRIKLDKHNIVVLTAKSSDDFFIACYTVWNTKEIDETLPDAKIEVGTLIHNTREGYQIASVYGLEFENWEHFYNFFKEISKRINVEYIS